MTDIAEKLNRAYQFLSAIPVSGDSVDLMAAARQEIKTVYAELKRSEADGGGQVDKRPACIPGAG